MANKHNADRRHHIPKMLFKVQNWPDYEAGLRWRGSLTLWIEEDALDQRPSIGPNGQARYRNIAIETCLMLRTAFKMALRQTEGLMESLLTLMNPTISAPDHTTVSRRAVGLTAMKSGSAPKGPLHLLIDSTGLEVFGAGQWLEAKHGAKWRRTWCKLHWAVDAESGMIVATGRLAWQTATGYGQRALIETTMGGYKSLIGPRLRARGFGAQQTEAAIGVAVSNRMLAAGRPDSVRCKRQDA